MNATEKLELLELLLSICADGKTILLIEHDVILVMGICDSLTVLDYGKVIASGKPADVRTHPEVIRAYLGQEAVYTTFNVKDPRSPMAALTLSRG
jgi:branched-chain amino acid transport system ATP-binding protein